MIYIKTQPIRQALFALVLLAFGAAQAQPAGEPQRLPVTQLRAGMHLIQAEVAQNDQQRAIGLMHRSSMPVNNGMLFIFEAPSRQCFWMRNTLLPLSIAFIADDGSIVNIAEMQPMSDDSHCSAKPVRYALEMNKGWFAKRGLKAGAKLSGGPWP